MFLLVASAFGQVDPPTFDVAPGFQSGPVSVQIVHPDPTVTLYYTTDFSQPNYLASPEYTAPLAIASNLAIRAIACTPTECSESATQSYLFHSQVITQTAPPGLPLVWGDAPADYAMDPEITGSPVDGPLVQAALEALPSMAITLDPYDFWDVDQGIYIKSTSRGQDWHRPISLEWFDAANGEMFQVNAGIHVSGGASRTQTRSPKHSLRLMFKSDYGPANLDWDFFGDNAVDEFDTLHLRGGYNSSWIHYTRGHRERAQYARDEWARRMQLEMGHPSPHGLWTHLYINGLYWGIYNLHERPDAGFLSRYLGGSKSDWDALNSGEATDGDTLAWQTLIDRVQLDQAVAANYRGTLEMVDVDNLIDYMILNQWMGNTDWDLKNWYAGRKRTPDGKWLFFSWDAESTLKDSVNEDNLAYLNLGAPTEVHQALMANAEYRMRFADRVHRNVNNGVFAPAAAEASYNALVAQLDPAIVAESARWGDYRRDVLTHPDDSTVPLLYTRQFWLDEQTRLNDEWFPNRRDVLLAQYRAADLYPAVDPVTMAPGAGRVAPGTTIGFGFDSFNGTAWYTTDGSDPRLEGGAVSAVATAFTAPIPIVQTTVVKARFQHTNGEWSALTDVQYLVDQPFNNLVLNEVMYNPDGSGAEFLELYNRGPGAVDLTGLAVVDGVDFVFDDLTVMQANTYFVLAESPSEFEGDYGFPPDGNYAGKLKNSGERVAIADETGTVWEEITYDDALPWPEEADGDGYSLELLSPTLDNTLPSSWQASFVDGGTPGADLSVMGQDADTDTDADSDTDVDTDTDSDVDADTDSDSDADSDADSDTDVDTDADADADTDTGEPEPGGCGCASSSWQPVGWVVLAGLAGLRRRS